MMSLLSRHALLAGPLLFGLLGLSACAHHVPLAALDFSEEQLRVGEADFSEFVSATESLRFSGTASLLPGRYAVPGDEFESIEIGPNTFVDFEADVLLQAEQENGHLKIRPAARSFSVQFRDSVVLVATPPDFRRVTLVGVRLDPNQENRLSVDVQMGQTLVESITQAIVGVPSGAESLPDSLDMFGRVEIEEVHLGLREGAEIHQAGNVFVVGPASEMSLQRVDLNIPEFSARFDIDANLSLAAGTCFATGDHHLCVDSGSFELRGNYNRRAEDGLAVERLQLTTVDRPSQLVLGAGRLMHRGEESEEILAQLNGARLRLTRYECGGPVDSDNEECVMTLHGDLDLSDGQIEVDDNVLSFDALHITRAVFSRDTRRDDSLTTAGGEILDVDTVDSASASAEHETAEDEESEAAPLLNGVALRSLAFAGVRLDSAGVQISFEGLEIRDVQGAGWDDLVAGAGELRATEGRVVFQLGEATIEGMLQGETRIGLRQGQAGFEINTTLGSVIVSAGQGRTIAAPSLAIRAEIGNIVPPNRERDVELVLRANAPVVMRSGAAPPVAPGTPAADVGPAQLAIEDLRLQFTALRVSRRSGEVRLSTEGLQLSLPEDEVLALLRPQIPPAIVGEERVFDERAQTVLRSITGLATARSLSRFRGRLDSGGFGGWELSFDRSRLRVQGELVLALHVLADETEVEMAVCHRQVTQTVSLPCFNDGMPGTCERTFSGDVPYPCVNESQNLTELFAGGLTVDLDLSGEVVSNAPTTLADLELTARIARCDRVVVRGIPEALQRAVDVQGAVCSSLSEESQTFALVDVAPAIATSPMLANARVETFRFDSDGERLRLDLQIEVVIDNSPLVIEAE